MLQMKKKMLPLLKLLRVFWIIFKYHTFKNQFLL